MKTACRASGCRPSGCPRAAPAPPRGCARARAPRRGSRSSRASRARAASRGCSPGRARRGRPSAFAAGQLVPPRRRAPAAPARRTLSARRPERAAPAPLLSARSGRAAVREPLGASPRLARCALSLMPRVRRRHDRRPRRMAVPRAARSCAARPAAGRRAALRTSGSRELLGAPVAHRGLDHVVAARRAHQVRCPSPPGRSRWAGSARPRSRSARPSSPRARAAARWRRDSAARASRAGCRARVVERGGRVEADHQIQPASRSRSRLDAEQTPPST